MEYKCPKCGEMENLHFNLDYTKQTRPVLDVLCNECGEFFGKIEQTFDVIEKRSIHWADVLTWLEKVANSCKTKEQAINCERLIWNFHRQYQKQLGLGECFNLTRKIDHVLLDLQFPSNYKKK
jgi:hypothetical protein